MNAVPFDGYLLNGSHYCPGSAFNPSAFKCRTGRRRATHKPFVIADYNFPIRSHVDKSAYFMMIMHSARINACRDIASYIAAYAGHSMHKGLGIGLQSDLCGSELGKPCRCRYIWGY